MGSYRLQEVIKMWEQDKLTVEQVVGQLLLHLEQLSERVGAVEKRVRRLPQEGDRPGSGAEQNG